MVGGSSVGALVLRRRAGFGVGSGRRLLKPWASRRVFSMIRLTASVPPLEIRWVSNRARTCCSTAAGCGRGGRPRGSGRSGNDAMTCSATSAALGRAVGLVDRAQLLVGMPGDGDLQAGVAGDQARVQFRDLLVGQVLAAAAQQTPDLVERVVLVTAPAQGVLLDAAADLVDDLGAELDDVEGVQHRDGVGQLVAQRVGVAAERVEGGVLDAGGEGLRSGPSARPRTRCRSGPGPRRATGRAGSRSRRGSGRPSRSPPDPCPRSVLGRQMCSSTPSVRTPVKPDRVCRPGGWLRPRPRPSRCASPRPRWRASAETVVSSWANASVAHQIARVVSFARGATSVCSSVNVTDRAGRLRRIARSACASRTSRTGPEARRVASAVRPAAVADRDHPARRAPRRHRRRSRRSAPAAPSSRGRPPGRASPARRTARRPERTSARPSHTYSDPCRGLHFDQAAWSLLILKASTPHPRTATPTAPTATHAQIRRAGMPPLDRGRARFCCLEPR